MKRAFSEDLYARIWEWGRVSKGALRSGGRIYFFGNGGSAADAQHLAAELVGRFTRERGAMAACALTANTSILTAIGNDYSFDDVFARQVEGLVRRGDVVVGITTSGRSRNVLKALELARKRGATTVVLTGSRGLSLKSMVDILVAVPCENTQHIQESHITIGHMYCEMLEARP